MCETCFTDFQSIGRGTAKRRIYIFTNRKITNPRRQSENAFLQGFHRVSWRGRRKTSNRGGHVQCSTDSSFHWRNRIFPFDFSPETSDERFSDDWTRSGATTDGVERCFAAVRKRARQTTFFKVKFLCIQIEQSNRKSGDAIDSRRTEHWRRGKSSTFCFDQTTKSTTRWISVESTIPFSAFSLTLWDSRFSVSSYIEIQIELLKTEYIFLVSSNLTRICWSRL